MQIAFGRVRRKTSTAAVKYQTLLCSDVFGLYYNMSSKKKLKFTRRLGRAVNDQEPVSLSRKTCFSITHS